MAQKYGLFNSVGGSPAYNDMDIAGMLSLLSGNAGYVIGYSGELAVAAGAGLQAVVATGAAWLGDPPGWWYINDEALTLDIDPEVVGYSRVDLVILRLDRNTEALSITAEVIKGMPAAAGPVAPLLTRNSTVYELSLANVLVTGGETSIAITDKRTPSVSFRSGTRIETRTAWTLSLSDMNQFVRCSSSSAININIPVNSSVTFPINTEVVIVQEDLGQITLSPAAGVTLISEDSGRKSDGIGTAFTLRKVDTDSWYAIGRLTT